MLLFFLQIQVLFCLYEAVFTILFTNEKSYIKIEFLNDHSIFQYM